MPLKYRPEKALIKNVEIPDEIDGRALNNKTKDMLSLMLQGISADNAYLIVKGHQVSHVARSNLRQKFKKMISTDPKIQKGFKAGLYNVIDDFKNMADRDKITFLRFLAPYFEQVKRQSETTHIHEFHPVKLEAFEKKKVSKQLEDGNTIDADYEEIQDDTA